MGDITQILSALQNKPAVEEKGMSDGIKAFAIIVGIGAVGVGGYFGWKAWKKSQDEKEKTQMQPFTPAHQIIPPPIPPVPIQPAHGVAYSEYINQGCFKYAHPSSGDPWSFRGVGMTPETCGAAAKNYRQPLFSVQAKDQCWTAGSGADYEKYGPSSACSGGAGPDGSMQVYMWN